MVWPAQPPACVCVRGLGNYPTPLEPLGPSKLFFSREYRGYPQRWLRKKQYTKKLKKLETNYGFCLGKDATLCNRLI
jgi:hypothetical protein